MTNGQRAAHAATQTIGLMLITAAFLVVVALTFLLFDGEDVAIFVVLAAVVGGAAILTQRFDTQWARALGVLGTVLSLGGFFLGFGLFQVFSPLEFTVAVAYVVGVVLSLIGGVMAIVASHKGRTGPSSAETRLPRVVLSVVGIAALISMFGFIFTRQTVSESEAAGATVIEMTKFEFAPDKTSTPSATSLLVSNSDPFVHDFTVDELGISVTVGPGSEALVDLADVAPGTYDYVCTLHFDGTSGMAGTLVVSS